MWVYGHRHLATKLHKRPKMSSNPITSVKSHNLGRTINTHTHTEGFNFPFKVGLVSVANFRCIPIFGPIAVVYFLSSAAGCKTIVYAGACQCAAIKTGRDFKTVLFVLCMYCWLHCHLSNAQNPASTSGFNGFVIQMVSPWPLLTTKQNLSVICRHWNGSGHAADSFNEAFSATSASFK